MAQFLKSPQLATAWCQRQRDQGKTVGYVPTMGALHDGHLSLVAESVKNNDVTCASIFVNPLQFNNSEDLEKYPQTLKDDLTLLSSVHCDMAYSGELADFFPEGSPYEKTVTSDASQDFWSMQGLEADCRPGHLQGVKAIVERLFATVGECRAYFGEKDFQQTLVVKEIAKRIGSIEICICPTVRESSGLAMSSRNRRLSATQKQLASKLYQSLLVANDLWLSGERSPALLEQSMRTVLEDSPISVEYTAIRDPDNWTAATPIFDLENAQGLVAAMVGDIRLIDNLRLGTIKK